MNASDWNLSTPATLKKVGEWGMYIVITVIDTRLNTLLNNYTIKLPSDQLIKLWQSCLEKIGDLSQWNEQLDIKIPIDIQSVIIPFNPVNKSINFKLVVFDSDNPLFQFSCRLGNHTWSVTKHTIEVGDAVLEDRFFSMKMTLGRMCNDIVTQGEVMTLPENMGVTALQIKAIRQFVPTKPSEYPKPPQDVRLDKNITVQLTPHQLLASFQKRLLNERLYKSIL